MLELQASVAKSEADCRAKDEQLASLKLLLNGLQLELQRCSDAEKDLTVRPCPPSVLLPLPLAAWAPCRAFLMDCPSLLWSCCGFMPISSVSPEVSCGHWPHSPPLFVMRGMWRVSAHWPGVWPPAALLCLRSCVPCRRSTTKSWPACANTTPGTRTAPVATRAPGAFPSPPPSPTPPSRSSRDAVSLTPVPPAGPFGPSHVDSWSLTDAVQAEHPTAALMQTPCVQVDTDPRARAGARGAALSRAQRLQRHRQRWRRRNRPSAGAPRPGSRVAVRRAGAPAARAHQRRRGVLRPHRPGAAVRQHGRHAAVDRGV